MTIGFLALEVPFYGQQHQKQTKNSEIFPLPTLNLKPTFGELHISIWATNNFIEE